MTSRVVVSIRVPCSPVQAFDIFTQVGKVVFRSVDCALLIKLEGFLFGNFLVLFPAL